MGASGGRDARRRAARALLRGAGAGVALPAALLAGAGVGAGTGAGGALGIAVTAAVLARLAGRGGLAFPPPGRPQGAAWGASDASALFAAVGSSGAFFAAWPGEGVWPAWGGPVAVMGTLAGLAGCYESARRERFGRMPPDFKHEDGGRYRGQWRGRNKHGVGCYIYPNGDSFEGEWQFNRKQGHGVYRYARGGFYAGGWEAGERHGAGVRVFPTGAQESGVWERGMRGKGGAPLADGGEAALQGAQAAVEEAQTAAREASWDPFDSFKDEILVLIPAVACAMAAAAGFSFASSYVPAVMGALAVLGMGTVGVHFPTSGEGEGGLLGGFVSDWAAAGQLILLKYCAALLFAAVWSLCPTRGGLFPAPPVPEELLRLCLLPATPLLLVYSRLFRLTPAWRRALDYSLILGTFAFAVLPFRALSSTLAASPSPSLGLSAAAAACLGGARAMASVPAQALDTSPPDSPKGPARGPRPLAATAPPAPRRPKVPPLLHLACEALPRRSRGGISCCAVRGAPALGLRLPRPRPPICRQ